MFLTTLVATASEELVTSEITPFEVIAWASGIATAVATGFTALFAIWFRRVDSPSPQWHIVFIRQEWSWDPDGGMSECSYWFRVGNAGNGIAQSVSLFGVYCDLEMRSQPNETRDLDIPIVEPGYIALLRLVAMPAKWEEAQLLVTWTEPSLWRRKRKSHQTVITLSEVFPEPLLNLDYPGTKRRTRRLKVVDIPLHQKEALAKMQHQLSKKERVVLASNDRRVRKKQFRLLQHADGAWQRVMPQVNQLGEA